MRSGDARAPLVERRPVVVGDGTGQTGRLLRTPGSLPGAIALVAGTTVGAGMLALPAVCQRSGFVPSTCTLAVCWLYMVATGLLLLEVNLDTMCEPAAEACRSYP